jgi:TonB family protein
VATCGARTVALHLPFPEQLKLDRLRKTNPQLAKWWDLHRTVRERAFGERQVFYGVTAAEEERLQQEGQAIVAEVRSGRFDAGLQGGCFREADCRSASFSADLRHYVGPLGRSGHEPKLVQAGQYQFIRYVAPAYPPLAMQARISGTVKLELTVDRAAGDVRDIRVIQGHPIFLNSVQEAVKQWRFAPAVDSEKIPADLVFQWTCPNPPVK